MEDERSLERLVVETTIRNCQRRLMYCDSCERHILLGVLNEARRELEEMDEIGLGGMLKEGKDHVVEYPSR